jgi:hypothetical protein
MPGQAAEKTQFRVRFWEGHDFSRADESENKFGFSR